MLVVETLAAKELYDINRTTENFEFLCEKRGKLETYIAELEALVKRLIEAGDRLSDSLCTYPEEEKTIEVCNWNAIVAEYKEREE
jgi:hypothetical protein